MKVQLTYPELVSIGKGVAAKLVTPDTIVVAVSRGGVSLAHIVAFHAKKQLNYFIPKDNKLFLTEDDEFSFLNTTSSKFLFVEDLYAKGRTYDLISKFMTKTNVSWSMVVAVLDGNVPQNSIPSNLSFYHRTTDWIVFPHEDIDVVNEGDWGLFREGTSTSARVTSKEEALTSSLSLNLK